jgi:DeoR/GlpR family transcriptional regulator of sugar metabolism
MLTSDRHSKLLEYLNAKRSATVDELASHLKISIATVRRDLTYLRDKGLLKRIHGGAVMKDQSIKYSYDVNETIKENFYQKKKIAEEADKLISEGDVIALATGSTIAILAELLVNYENLTVITNSIPVLNRLSINKSITLICTGGEFDNRTMGFNGTLSRNQIIDFRIDKFFVSCHGYDDKRGCSDIYVEESESKKTFASVSKEVIVLADSSKFKASSFSLSLYKKDISMIITDCCDKTITYLEVVVV